MDDDTVSVSKGVFLFKNGFKNRQTTSTSKKKSPIADKSTLKNPWYIAYKTLWTRLESQIQILHDEMFRQVIKDVEEWAARPRSFVDEIPTAVLLTGTNTPDQGAFFKALSKQLVNAEYHVAALEAAQCGSSRGVVDSLTRQLLDTTRRGCATWETLRSWHSDEGNGLPIVVLISDCESFPELALRQLVLGSGSLPLVLILGVATSPATLHRSLPARLTARLNIAVFRTRPVAAHLGAVLDHVFLTPHCPLQLSRPLIALLTDIFLFYDLSVTSFISNLRYAVLDHFSYGNAMTLCCPLKEAEQVLRSFTHEDFESVRRLLSFRKLVEAESHKNRIELLTNDEFLKKRVLSQLTEIDGRINNFHCYLRCLAVLVLDLPRSPLGKQFRELYTLAIADHFTESSEYKEAFQLLGFLSRDEMLKRLTSIALEISNNSLDNFKKQFLQLIGKYIDELNNVTTVLEVNEASQVEVNTNHDEKMTRQQILAKLIERSRNPQNRYSLLLADILSFLNATFNNYLSPPPAALPLSELRYARGAAEVREKLIGGHRAAIHTALEDPASYLRCSCCKDGSMMTMPDVCVAYKLHLECGKMVNLYDWLQAFVAVKAGGDAEITEEMQARFTQAVAELEFLGFIKSSKRKADHVARLTWGGS